MRLLRLSVVVSALVAAGCSSVAPDDTSAFTPGTGTVEGVHAPRVARWIDGYQLSLRMDDGTVQAITQDSSEFHAGDRVQVTQEGRVLKVPASQASATSAVRPGSGTIQSVTPAGTSAQQVSLAMDDGSTQVVTLQGATVRPGERVSITADGHMLRP